MNTIEHRHDAAFQLARLGPLAELGLHRFSHPSFPGGVPGKVFLGQRLGLTGAEISVNRLPPGGAVPFLHCHRHNEEIYLFLGGRGEFQAGQQVVPVDEGTAIRVAPELPRAWRAIGPDPLYYLVIQVPVGGYVGAGTVEDGIRCSEPPRWNTDPGRAE